MGFLGIAKRHCGRASASSNIIGEVLSVNGGGPQFSYLGPSGPQKWGNLSPTYSACSNGRFQSPVNIVRSKCVSGRHLKPLDVEYSLAANATLVDNLFNVAMKFDGNVGVLRLNDKNFSFIQMHWHSPSEHQLDGVRYDAELHLVHKADDGGIAVIAVLYRYGHPDPLLTKIQSKLAQLMKVVHHSSSHEQPQVPLGTFTTKQIRKHTRKYYRYVGSFSTPPCTEGVIWNILGKVRKVNFTRAGRGFKGTIDLGMQEQLKTGSTIEREKNRDV
ncbi:hypothetical protein Ccrd_009562 [Cynara cardunculus var. scolymus]|uniref:Carbonic anhydrase n=1 Tax=Cynara cardunculus var. scolymus TaxID=59895 RepID=A0A103YMT8_CYNCS|nr:hypothetical protein Ccrd_009562 [Cynara cardunculus var. scolymus]